MDIEKLYVKYREDLVGLAFVKLGNHEDAEDVVQQAFVDVLTDQNRSVDSEEHFKHLIEKAVKCDAVDLIRKKNTNSYADKTLGRAVEDISDDSSVRPGTQQTEAEPFNAILDLSYNARLAAALSGWIGMPAHDDYGDESWP